MGLLNSFQEVDDPNYDRRTLPIGVKSRAGAKPTSDNLGCFGASKAKRKDGSEGALPQHSAAPVSSRGPRTGPHKGMDLLWQPEVGAHSIMDNGSMAHILSVSVL